MQVPDIKGWALFDSACIVLLFTSAPLLAQEMGQRIEEVSVAPHAARIDITVDCPQYIRIDLFDTFGRKLHRIYEGYLEAEKTNTFSLDDPDLTSGTYIYKVTGANFSRARQFELSDS